MAFYPLLDLKNLEMGKNGQKVKRQVTFTDSFYPSRPFVHLS